eukprot:XP_001706380.1 Hypothetical protein GL50803_29106 [Giardia lamblia ATCC 50803]
MCPGPPNAVELYLLLELERMYIRALDDVNVEELTMLPSILAVLCIDDLPNAEPDRGRDWVPPREFEREFVLELALDPFLLLCNDAIANILCSILLIMAPIFDELGRVLVMLSPSRDDGTSMLELNDL